MDGGDSTPGTLAEMTLSPNESRSGAITAIPRVTKSSLHAPSSASLSCMRLTFTKLTKTPTKTPVSRERVV